MSELTDSLKIALYMFILLSITGVMFGNRGYNIYHLNAVISLVFGAIYYFIGNEVSQSGD